MYTYKSDLTYLEWVTLKIWNILYQEWTTVEICSLFLQFDSEIITFFLNLLDLKISITNTYSQTKVSQTLKINVGIHDTWDIFWIAL